MLPPKIQGRCLCVAYRPGTRIEWAGQPVQFPVRYHCEDMNVPGAICSKAKRSIDELGYNPAAQVLHECTRRMEEMMLPADDK